MKTFIVCLIVTLTVFAVNKNFLSRIEKLEGRISFEKKQVEKIQKELRKRMAEYYNKANLKDIELEFSEKGIMKRSKEIKYFKLEDKEKDVQGN